MLSSKYGVTIAITNTQQYDHPHKTFSRLDENVGDKIGWQYQQKWKFNGQNIIAYCTEIQSCQNFKKS